MAEVTQEDQDQERARECAIEIMDWWDQNGNKDDRGDLDELTDSLDEIVARHARRFADARAAGAASRDAEVEELRRERDDARNDADNDERILRHIDNFAWAHFEAVGRKPDRATNFAEAATLLEGELARLLAEATALRSEVEGLRRLANEAHAKLDDTEDLVDCLRRIGDIIGCNHVQGKDDRARFVRCVRDEIERLTQERDAIARLCYERDEYGTWTTKPILPGEMRAYLMGGGCEADIINVVRAAAGLAPMATGGGG